MATIPPAVDPGKVRGFQRVTSDDGFFLICALDHLSDFAELLSSDPSSVTFEQTVRAKLDLVAALAPAVSAFLLDPLYALGHAVVSGSLPASVGLMSSIEDEGYHGRPGARTTRFRGGWSARKIKLLGADVCKLLWFYRPDADTASRQRDVVKRLVDESAELSLPLVVEPIWYLLEGEDSSSPEWQARRVQGIVASAHEAAALGVDMVKAEFPGVVDSDEGRDAALKACQELDEGIAVPWVILSAGVGYDEFRAQVEIACRAGASGYLAGRSIWRDAASTHSPDDRQQAINDARSRLVALNDVTRQHGRPFRPEQPVEEVLMALPQGWYSDWHTQE